MRGYCHFPGRVHTEGGKAREAGEPQSKQVGNRVKDRWGGWQSRLTEIGNLCQVKRYHFNFWVMNSLERLLGPSWEHLLCPSPLASVLQALVGPSPVSLSVQSTVHNTDQVVGPGEAEEGLEGLGLGECPV